VDVDQRADRVCLSAGSRRLLVRAVGAFKRRRARVKQRKRGDVRGGDATSLPAQNSASVIWPLMTSSRCKDARSGLATRTDLRSRKSVVASVPAMTGVRPSLETEAALDVDACELGRRGFGVAGEEAGKEEEKGCLENASKVDLLRPMMEVSSALKDSRSA
jgi:hypothetical protein